MFDPWTDDQRLILHTIRLAHPDAPQRALADDIWLACIDLLAIPSSLTKRERKAVTGSGLGDRTFASIYGALRRMDLRIARGRNESRPDSSPAAIYTVMEVK